MIRDPDIRAAYERWSSARPSRRLAGWFLTDAIRRADRSENQIRLERVETQSRVEADIDRSYRMGLMESGVIENRLKNFVSPA